MSYPLGLVPSQASQLLKNPKVLKFLEQYQNALDREFREEFFLDVLEARKVIKISDEFNAESFHVETFFKLSNSWTIDIFHVKKVVASVHELETTTSSQLGLKVLYEVTTLPESER